MYERLFLIANSIIASQLSCVESGAQEYNFCLKNSELCLLVGNGDSGSKGDGSLGNDDDGDNGDMDNGDNVFEGDGSLCDDGDNGDMDNGDNVFEGDGSLGDDGDNGDMDNGDNVFEGDGSLGDDGDNGDIGEGDNVSKVDDDSGSEGDIGNGLGDDENNAVEEDRAVDSKGDVSELDDKIVFWNLGQLILLRFTKVSSVLSSATSESVPMISMQSKSIYVCIFHYHIIMNKSIIF